MNSYTFEGRTYYRAGSNSGFDGDLNHGAGGDYIYLYYTRDRAGLHSYGNTQRVITQLSVTGGSEDGLSSTCAVLWRGCNYGGAADMNKNASGDFIFIQQHFATQTLTMNNHPKAVENIVYDGTPQFLVASNPSGNYGTMKYRVGQEGSFSSSLPRATEVGTYTVEYMLDGGSYAYNSAVGSLEATIQPPVFKATTFDATFNQATQSVYLTWTLGATPGNYSDFQWVLYRGNTRIATLDPGQRSYSDRGFRNEQEETYTLYYVSNAWDINTQKEEAAVSKTISCSRSMPVNNFQAEAYDDYIELAWTSDGYPEDFGHTFKIFVNDETEPIYTIVPGDYQTSYVWQHRTTSEHTNRQNGVDEVTGVPYTAEPLNGCQPRTYRVEGWIDDVKISEVTTAKRGIGQGTLFVDFDAEKGVYPGVVKLAWQVNQQQETYTSKNYIIDRRLAERTSDPWTTIHRMSSAEEYLLFTDETPLPGVYYDYRITVQDKCPDGTVKENEITDIGFARTTGTVSGRITYGSTGTAVAGVDVMARKADESGNSNEKYHSMHFTTNRGAVQWQYPSEDYLTNLLSGDFSIQLWIYPEQLQDCWFMYLANNNLFSLGADGSLSFIGGNDNDSNEYPFAGLTLQPETYSFLTFTRSGNTLTAYLITQDENGSTTRSKAVQTLTTSLSVISSQPVEDIFRLGYFKGYADEFRLWTRCLSEEEVNENYDHLLIGNEQNLETYWTFDEGLKYQFFDYSRDGTFYHQHHGKVGSNAESSTLTPSALSLKARTDEDGNYIIQGIPFAGEGATYSIIPTFGIHRFNPTQQLRYMGNSSLVHNSVDFDDVSSFRVRGVAYYEHTTVPVQEAYIYVDGSIASRDGEAVMTNDYGEFEVSVPIGDHFVSIKKQGHTFLNDGRYPADPEGVGVRHTFDRELSGLTFYDQTTVTVAGRVTGGDIEHEKALGLGISKATIGQAKIELHLSNENGYLNATTPDASSTSVSYDISSDTLRYVSPRGHSYVPAGKNYIVVETDPATGEWVAQLPPLRYEVTDVKIPSRPETDMIGKNDFSLPSVDATHTTAIYADSVQDEKGEWRRFEYMASVKMEYKAPSVMELTENKNGTFGMKTYTVKDMNGKPLSFKLWQASTGKIYNLTPSARQKFHANALRGISPAEPIRLSTSAGEVQQLSLLQGWNWVSWYVRPANAKLDYIFPIESGFSEGDLIKSPTAQSFAELTVTPDSAAWKGSLSTTNYKNMYMMRVRDGFNTTVEGKALTDEQRTLTIRRGWNGIAYLLSEPMSTRDALADYFDKATVGDLIKSRTQFAVFTENGKWEGSLQTLRPGQGYLLKRNGTGSVTMKYVKTSAANAPKRVKAVCDQQSAFSNPKASTNMTMICAFSNSVAQMPLGGIEATSASAFPTTTLQVASGTPIIRAYIGDELVGVAEPIIVDDQSLYFLTIQSDAVGTLRFETADGQRLTATVNCQLSIVNYQPDAHHGTMKAPVLLRPAEECRPYKIIENDHVIIIRNNEKYDVTGQKL